MLKVLHIIYSAKFGGIENLVLDLANSQNAAGNMKVEVLILKPQGEFLQKLEETGIHIHKGNLRGGYDINPAKYFKLFRLFKKFHILHFHNFNLFVALVAAFARVKILYTEHGNFAFGRDIRFSDKLNFMFRRFFLNSIVNGISFNSQFTRKYSHDILKVSSKNERVIYNGVAEKKLKNHQVRTELRLPAGAFLIGTSSRLAAAKCIDRLIRGFAKFNETIPKSYLLIVGEGPERSNLEFLAEALGLNGRVIFCGYKSNVQDYQNAMDVCVFPSLNEPFGLVAVECLRLGKPVLVWQDGGGITEIIEQKFPQDIVTDENDLAHKIQKYLQGRFKYNKQVRKDYAENYSVEKMMLNFYTFYSQL